MRRKRLSGTAALRGPLAMTATPERSGLLAAGIIYPEDEKTA
jgi:hypothetical protein